MPRSKKKSRSVGGNTNVNTKGSVRKMRNNSQYATQSQVGGFPNIERVKLVYTEVVTRAPTGVTGTDYVFSGNGLFDPNITGTGAQPINYDDFAAIYNRYRVLSSTIIIQNHSVGSATGTGSFWGALGARHSTTARVTYADQVDAASNPHAYGKFYLCTTTPEERTFTLSKSTATVLGYEQTAVRDDDTLQALTSANPAHQWYWHIMTSMVDQTSTGAINHYVRIIYDVEFFDRIDTASDLIVRVPREMSSQVRALIVDAKKVNSDATYAVSNHTSPSKYGIRSPYVRDLTMTAPGILNDIVHVSTIPEEFPILMNDAQRKAYEQFLQERKSR